MRRSSKHMWLLRYMPEGNMYVCWLFEGDNEEEIEMMPISLPDFKGLKARGMIATDTWNPMYLPLVPKELKNG